LVQGFTRCLPSSIQVTTSQRAPVVSIYYAIWIQHWNYFKHEIIPQKLGFF
jgi:hypothetical protein